MRLKISRWNSPGDDSKLQRLIKRGIGQLLFTWTRGPDDKPETNLGTLPSVLEGGPLTFFAGVDSVKARCTTRNFIPGSWLEPAFLFYARSVFTYRFLVSPEASVVRKIFVAAGILLLGVALAVAQQKSLDDEGGRVLALENAWNHALEAKDAKALDMILANTFVSIDIDGSVSSKSEFLASIKAPSYQPSQAVTEQSNVHVYGEAAVVVGIFRVKGIEKGKPYVHRERFADTWIKMNGTWQCVATTGTLISAKQTAD